MNNFWFLTQVCYPSTLREKQERLPIFREPNRTNPRIAEDRAISSRFFDQKNDGSLVPYHCLNRDVINPRLLQLKAPPNNLIDQPNENAGFRMQEVLEQEAPKGRSEKITLAKRLEMVIKQLIREEGKTVETPSVRNEVPAELENQYRYKEQEYQAMFQDVKAKWLEGKELKENNRQYSQNLLTFEARIQGWSVTQVARNAGNRRDTYYRSPYLKKRLRSIKEVITYILFGDSQNVRTTKNKIVEEEESNDAQTSTKRRRVTKNINEVKTLNSSMPDDSNSLCKANSLVKDPPQFQLLDLLLGKDWMNKLVEFPSK